MIQLVPYTWKWVRIEINIFLLPFVENFENWIYQEFSTAKGKEFGFGKFLFMAAIIYHAAH